MPEYEITYRKPIAKGAKRQLTWYLESEDYIVNYEPREDNRSAVFTTDRPLDGISFDRIRTSHHATGLKQLE